MEHYETITRAYYYADHDLERWLMQEFMDSKVITSEAIDIAHRIITRAVHKDYFENKYGELPWK